MKMKKKTLFCFSILKIFWFMSFAVNFLKSLGKNSKKNFTTAQMRSKLKLSRSLEFISAFFKAQQVINTRRDPFFTLSECLSNVLITGEPNLDERNGQMIRGSFKFIQRNNFLKDPYFRYRLDSNNLFQIYFQSVLENLFKIQTATPSSSKVKQCAK